MKNRFLRSMILLSAFIIAVTAILISSVVYSQFYNEMKAEVRQEAERISQGAITAQPDTTSGRRITLIAQDGRVIYDNRAAADSMENHLERTEVRDALQKGTGESSRLSVTMGKQTYYYAVRLEDGRVLRVAQSTESGLSALMGCVPYIALIVVLVFAAAAVIGNAQIKRIVGPVNNMNLEEPLANDVYEEFAPLLARMQKQKEQIGAQMAELNSRREELASITGNMNEGLVILDDKGMILSVNKSAGRIFDCGYQDVTGCHYVTLNRGMTFKEAAEGALSGEKGDYTITLEGSVYELLAAPIMERERAAGAVILVLDITARAEAEQRRREFTANVSHELKTPLTCIMGYAELIKDGIARGEEASRFIEKLYDEAGRLLSLIEDIIKLSHMDEGQKLQRERLDLSQLARKAAGDLAEKAQKAGVTVRVEGKSAEIEGSRALIYELIYNLIDNAIKYNRRDGEVNVMVLDEPDGPAITVADTGIGIAPEHQGRIFERFYRVDKSRSRETGGTGLGLAIVKNAAAAHGAELTLESVPEKGSVFGVHFKAQ